MTEASEARGTTQVHKDSEGAKIGMWLFLFTEMVLFGGLFILYSAYRTKYPKEFHEGGQALNYIIGVANTVVLLTSSLTMALSISAIQKGSKRLSMLLVGITVTLALVFLINKGFEWGHEFHEGIYPNSATLGALPHGLQLFYGLYFTMTGLHGLHVLAGIVVLLVMLRGLSREWIRKDDFIKLENSGLYWHLVDVIWIFLLPLFYLAA
jgi:cytochrome c oxidase subunit III